MPDWNIAAVQFDCKLADKLANLRSMRVRLREAAEQGCRLIVFPECALAGYGFASRDEAIPHAESIPGPTTDLFVKDCRELNVYCVVGMLEYAEERLYNACALIGPSGLVGSYRKIHLPCLGVDRFVTPGDRPFAVHDIEGLRVGMNICYDGSFPEAARVLALLGADLIVLPTNWPEGARLAGSMLAPARALENHVYYLAANRVGEEAGFRFIGRSLIVDYRGEELATGAQDRDDIVQAVIDPIQARDKRVVILPGLYEVDRVGHRRPEMYAPLLHGSSSCSST